MEEAEGLACCGVRKNSPKKQHPRDRMLLCLPTDKAEDPRLTKANAELEDIKRALALLPRKPRPGRPEETMSEAVLRLIERSCTNDPIRLGCPAYGFAMKHVKALS
jgi:hypothetical protein